MELRCEQCEQVKPLSEFFQSVQPYYFKKGQSCDHFVGECMRCLINVAENEGACLECGREYAFEFADSLRAHLGRHIHPVLSQSTMMNFHLPPGSQLTLFMLDGTSMRAAYEETTTVADLKRAVAASSNVNMEKVRLVFEGRELKPNDLRIKAQGVTPGAQIQAMIVLFNIDSAKFDTIFFRVSWSEAGRGVGGDYLDAICVVYDKFLSRPAPVDFSFGFPNHPDLSERERIHVCQYIEHEEITIDDPARARSCRQQIKIIFGNIPPTVEHFYFTLCSYKLRNIAEFRQPTFTLHDSRDPRKELCSYELTKAVETPAVILCSISREDDEHWAVFEHGIPSPAPFRDPARDNRRNCKPLVDKISSLMGM